MIRHKETDTIQNEYNNLPEEWELIKLSDCADFKNGINFTREEKGEKGILTVDVLNMYSNNIFVRLENLYRVQKNVKDEYILRNGDILFVRSSLKREGVGFASLFKSTKEDVTYCGFIIRARLRSEKVVPEFLTYFARSNSARESLISKSGKVTITNINQGILGNLIIPLPPLSEQRNIAFILSSVQETIEKTEAVIQASQELKKSLMNHLFTYGPVPITEREQVQLKETEIGKIPEEWEIKEFQNLGDFKYGYTTSAVNFDTGVKFLRITDIQDDGYVNWEKVPYAEIDEEDILKFKLKEGDILFARIGATTGKTCLIKPDTPKGVFASYLIRFQLREKYLPTYFFYYTTSSAYWNLVNAGKGGKLKKGLNAPQLKKFKLPTPSYRVQVEIARILTITDFKISQETKKKDELGKLFKSLLENLMTGKIRVKDIIFKNLKSTEMEL